MSEETKLEVQPETKQEARPQRAQASAGGALLMLAGGVAGGLIGWAGLQMVTMQSVAGNTLAEAYYQANGWACLGLALFCTCVLWSLAAIVGRK
jgi:hypothetical protein